MSLTALIGPVTSIIDKLIPDKEAADKAKIKLLELEQQGSLGELQIIADLSKAQAEINKQEAAHKSLFVAGWRPFIGWVCGAGVAWQFVFMPLLAFFLPVYGISEELPAIPTESLFELILAMLGMGGLRTFEKIKGTARER
ncbi:MAG: holin family protein [Proteobacteria bacterium]|nr:holin family protein [Pseudomonadota bacterium]